MSTKVCFGRRGRRKQEKGGGERKRLIIPRHDTQYEEKDAVRIQRRV